MKTAAKIDVTKVVNILDNQTKKHDMDAEKEGKGCEEKKVESSAVKNVVVTTAGDRTLFPCPLNSYSTMYCRTSIKFFSLQSIVIVLFVLTALVCSLSSQLWHDASPALDVQPPLHGDTFLQDDEDHYTTSLIPASVDEGSSESPSISSHPASVDQDYGASDFSLTSSSNEEETILGHNSNKNLRKLQL